jgi:glycerol-3-phosphate O-acyltransferase/dihydroxyacetone phosphate acyltransferase
MSQQISPPPVSWLYDIILNVFSLAVQLFFRDVQVRGTWRIPSKGPVILVAAPHSNQVSAKVEEVM